MDNTDLISLGYASQVFQRSPAELKIVLDGQKSKPALTLNGVAYYPFADVVRAKSYLDSLDGSKADA